MSESGEPASQRPPLTRITRAEWALLLVLVAIHFTHMVDFVILMPLGGRLMTELAITPAQEGAWAAYQSAIRPPARDGGRRGPGAREDLRGLTTPQRMDRMVQEANQRHAEVLGRAAAIRQFYGQLSAEQKKTFDTLPQVGPGGGHHGGRMGPDPRGGRGFGEGPRGPRPGAVAG